MLPWKLRKRQILPVNQNFSSVYFSLAKFQLVSCNLSLAMIWQMTRTHKLPKLCSDTLNERQSSSDKKHNKSLRLVLFFPFRCCFAGSLPFFSSTMKQTKLFHSISEMFFTFLARKTLSKTFLVECARGGAASCIKRREFWRETHTPLWLLIGRIIFLTREKTSFAILIGLIIFFTCENHRSLL